MKFIKYSIFLFILLVSYSCKKTTLTVTGPGPELFLNKMENGKWNNITVNGNKLKINNDSYTFDSAILGIGGIYEQNNNTGGKGYMIAIPFGNTLCTIDVDKEAKNAISEIMNIVGNEYALGVITGLVGTNDGDVNYDKIDVDRVIGNANITENERNRIEKLIGNLSSSNFGQYTEHK